MLLNPICSRQDAVKQKRSVFLAGEAGCSLKNFNSKLLKRSHMVTRTIHCWINKLLVIVMLSSYCVTSVFAQDTIVFTEGMSVSIGRGGSETILITNPVEASLVNGTWKVPQQGDKVTMPDGRNAEWNPIKANPQGWMETNQRGLAYVYCELDLSNDTNLIIRLLGNDMVYVNGVPRVGNVYGSSETYASWEKNWNFVTLPVHLKKGKNEFLFRLSRGKLKALLYAPEHPLTFIRNDYTLPDLIKGEEADLIGGIAIVNSTPIPRKGLIIRSRIGTAAWYEEEVPVIQPFSLRKCAFRLCAGAFRETGVKTVSLEILDQQKKYDTVTFQVRVVERSDNRKETFISKIDGSVQYYSILPPRGFDWKTPTGLFFSVHGASVEAINQSGSYHPKTWGMVASPTNRRPYGYNWEDWGRLDALEVLDIIKKKYPIDENRVYLTGHSMGGHGTWHLGAMYPDQFAAIGPSAGWISFWSYRFRDMNLPDTTPFQAMIRRSTSASETPLFADNYKQLGVYVIHGEDDDNVLIREAKLMLDRLNEIGHKDVQYHFEPKAGHWWDNSEEPGADCVDWPPMFDFFARHARPGKHRILQVDFLTSNPGISARNNWLLIDAQHKQLKMSEAHIRFEPGTGRFTGTTNNVARLALDLDILQQRNKVIIELDRSRRIETPVREGQTQLWLENSGGRWSICEPPLPGDKQSGRYATFKEVFRNGMVFVYGTAGTEEERQWAFNKARFDAERFWYQGNGSVEVIPDTDFDTLAYAGRNIILFGNRTTNRAWDLVLGHCPVKVESGLIQAGARKFASEELACLFIYPRANTKDALIGVIGGTGLKGMKVTDRLPYLSPGIGLPDCTILDTKVMTEGEAGVVFTGFFGLDWSLDKGEFVSQ